MLELLHLFLIDISARTTQYNPATTTAIPSARVATRAATLQSLPPRSSTARAPTNPVPARTIPVHQRGLRSFVLILCSTKPNCLHRSRTVYRLPELRVFLRRKTGKTLGSSMLEGQLSARKLTGMKISADLRSHQCQFSSDTLAQRRAPSWPTYLDHSGRHQAPTHHRHDQAVRCL